MTYTPIQLEVIRVFGRKELTEGCIFLGKFWYGGISNMIPAKICFESYQGFHVIYTNMYGKESNCEYDIYGKREYFEILGHIPEIFPDVAIVAEERGWLLEIKFGLLTIHFKDRTFTSCKYNTILPLLEQPESVLIELLTIFK